MFKSDANDATSLHTDGIIHQYLTFFQVGLFFLLHSVKRSGIAYLPTARRGSEKLARGPLWMEAQLVWLRGGNKKQE